MTFDKCRFSWIVFPAAHSIARLCRKSCRLAFRLWLLVIVPGVGLAGCGHSGPAKYKVDGIVNWNGEPVAGGDVIVKAVDGGTRAEGAKIVKGKFALHIEAGRKKVQIFASRDVPGKIDPAMQAPPRESYIPPRYNVNTILEAEVLPQDDNRWTFDLPQAN